jgi:hypothetical protein
MHQIDQKRVEFEHFRRFIEKTSDLDVFPGGPPGQREFMPEFPLGIGLARGVRPPIWGLGPPEGGRRHKNT